MGGRNEAEKDNQLAIRGCWNWEGLSSYSVQRDGKKITLPTRFKPGAVVRQLPGGRGYTLLGLWGPPNEVFDLEGPIRSDEGKLLHASERENRWCDCESHPCVFHYTGASYRDLEVSEREREQLETNREETSVDSLDDRTRGGTGLLGERIFRDEGSRSPGEAVHWEDWVD